MKLVGNDKNMNIESLHLATKTEKINKINDRKSNSHEHFGRCKRLISL